MTTIFNYLCQSISSLMNSYSFENDALMTETPSFGASEWKDLYRIDVESPSIPLEIERALGEPCPFHPGKLRKETHLLCLVPPGLKELICDGNALVTEGVHSTPSKPYWILITKKTIQSTSTLSHDDKIEVLSHAGYQLPSVLEAAVAVLAGNHFNTRVYPTLNQFTVCKEVFNTSPLLVGYDRSSGFTIYTNNWKQTNKAAGVYRP